MNETSTPGWNASTTCLQTLHRNMTEQGWGDWEPAVPICSYNFGGFAFTITFDLPRRPLDLGAGLWR